MRQRGEGIDFEILFVPGGHGKRPAVPFEDSFIEAVYGIDKGCLEVESGFRDGGPFTFPNWVMITCSVMETM